MPEYAKMPTVSSETCPGNNIIANCPGPCTVPYKACKRQAAELTAVSLLNHRLIYRNCSQFECHYTWFSITQTRKSKLCAVRQGHDVISYNPMGSFWNTFIFPLFYLFFPFRYPLPWQENLNSHKKGYVTYVTICDTLMISQPMIHYNAA